MPGIRPVFHADRSGKTFGSHDRLDLLAAGWLAGWVAGRLGGWLGSGWLAACWCSHFMACAMAAEALLLLLMAASPAFLSGQPLPGSFQASPYLPPLLTFDNGSTVSTPAAWRERRKEILKLVEQTFSPSLTSMKYR